MKIFGVDVSAKRMTIEVDGKTYDIHFRHSVIKGTYDVSVWGDERGQLDAKIVWLYPPLNRVISELWSELWRVYLPQRLRAIKSRLTRNR